jgi:hypothetical protein
MSPAKPLCSLNHIVFGHLELPQFKIGKVWHEAPDILELLEILHGSPLSV